ISSQTNAGSVGNAGDVAVKVGSLSIVNGGLISSSALGPFNNLSASIGNAGQVMVTAGTLSIANNGAIRSDTAGPGKAGSVIVNVADQLTITGTSGGRFAGVASNAQAGSTGNAGNVVVSAGSLTILRNGEIASGTFGSGKGGSVSVSVVGQLMIDATSAD